MKILTYRIVFRRAGEVMQVWAGYVSYAAAVMALRDVDLCIPFEWDAEIEAQE